MLPQQVGSDQVENTSVSGARAGGEGGRGVKVEVRREDEPAGFEDLIMMVLRSEGPPVSYARIEAPTAITLTVPPAPGIKKRIHNKDSQSS